MIKLLVVFLINFFLFSCSNKASDLKLSTPVEHQHDSIIRVNNGAYFGELHSSLSYDTLSEEFSYADKFSSPIVISQKIIFYDSLNHVINEFNPKFRQLEVETVTKSNLKMSSVYIWDICIVNSNKGVLYSIYGSSFCNGVLCPEYKAYFSSKGDLLDFGYSDIYAKREKMKAISEIEKEFEINSKTENCKDINYFWD